jgi:hypothetical protein
MPADRLKLKTSRLAEQVSFRAISRTSCVLERATEAGLGWRLGPVELESTRNRAENVSPSCTVRVDCPAVPTRPVETAGNLSIPRPLAAAAAVS